MNYTEVTFDENDRLEIDRYEERHWRSSLLFRVGLKIGSFLSGKNAFTDA